MKWEVKELPNGRWGVFLCKKYWKFKDKPVMYSSAITKESAEQRVARLNNPNNYSFDEKYVSVGQAREREKRQRAIERSIKRSTFILHGNKKIKECVINVQISCGYGIIKI